MTVTASATEYGTAAVSQAVPSAGYRAAVALAVLVVAALGVAVAFPADVVVLGVLVAGAAHVVLEVRYVVGRHPEVVEGTAAVLLQAALLAVLVARIASPSGVSRGVELAVWALLLVIALVWRFGDVDSGPLAVGVGLVAGTTVVAIAAGPAWFLVLAHAHNLVPAVFLWRWSGRALEPHPRRRLRQVIVGWTVVVPTLILAGALDTIAGTGSGVANRLFGIEAATATVAPPDWVDATAGHRLLVAFAFAQLVHYAVWIWYLPRHDPATTAAFSVTPPGRALRSWRLPAAVVVGTLAVVAVAAVDYRQGRTFYSSLGAYHAYLEYPVLFGLLIDRYRRRTRAVPAR